MRVVHVPASAEGGSDRGWSGGAGPRTLATDVELADSTLTKAKGLMGRSSVPANYALVFPFDGASKRWIHTWLVRTPIDVVWTVDEEVTRVETMRPWLGLAAASADRVLEFQAGGAEGVEPGDVLRVEE